ncbi:MAG: tRNA pseudouridine(38-40) synthase TruA [Planctomycetia bacterium]|nr:MAG: tRNA pseudouridine(38-40) synthase TruA [Planctomycetia bacterium]
MTRNVRLLLAYDGSAFHGWQTQPEVRTVQAEVADRLQRILRHRITLWGASRTDAGVHARGQCANFLTESDIPAERLFPAVAHHLPEDICLHRLHDVHPEFHAGRDALCKLYRYTIQASAIRPSARQSAGSAWHVWTPLDLDRMRAAASLLVGTHDFASFATTGSNRESTTRTIRRFEIHGHCDRIAVDVIGDGFLYNQVRNMVGTLVEVGRGRWTPEHVSEILAARDRRAAGPTAPPHGLTLHWIEYPPQRLRPPL